MKKSMFAVRILLVVAVLVIGNQALAKQNVANSASTAATRNSETKINYQPLTVQSLITQSPTMAQSPTSVSNSIVSAPDLLMSNNNQMTVAPIILAENIKAGIFGNNTGGGTFSFPGNLVINGRQLSFGRGMAIRAEDSQMSFNYGSAYLFDNNVGIGTVNPGYKLEVNGAIKANGYYSANGKIGLSNTYNLKASNGQNCTMTFSNGLMTASNCPATSIMIQESIK